MIPARYLVVGLFLVFAAQPALAADAEACPAVLDYSFSSLQTGKTESLCQYRGKVLLIVNTASYCGYTHQYEGLEALYRKYQAKGLVILGFPMNDFGGQEPGSNKEISQFCVNQYAIDFPMFSKTTLKGNSFFKELQKTSGKSPQWKSRAKNC